MTEEIDNKLKMIIGKVAKLGWLQLSPDGEPIMHLADVEKTIYALFDDFEMKRIDRWVEEAEKGGIAITKLKEMPSTKIHNLEVAREVDAQVTGYMGKIIKGEACIMRICPFFKQEVPQCTPSPIDEQDIKELFRKEIAKWKDEDPLFMAYVKGQEAERAKATAAGRERLLEKALEINADRFCPNIVDTHYHCCDVEACIREIFEALRGHP